MKVVSLITGSNNPFDIPREFAAHLIAKGEVREWIQPSTAPGHDLQWAIKFTGDGKVPYIFADCPNCHPKYFYQGANPEKQFVPHAGQRVPIPEVIILKYIEHVKRLHPVPAERFETPVHIDI
jgi:hypothetical protein